MRRTDCVIAILALALPAARAACNDPAASASFTVSLPGRPFAVAGSPDGCWLFVSLTGGGAAGIAVLQRDGGHMQLARVVRTKTPPTGLAPTHDGKLLVATAGDSVMVLDTARMISGKGDAVLGTFHDGPGAASIYANVTADDKLLFVSDERTQTITVINLERARSEGFRSDAIVGQIPVGRAPIALTFSPDGRWLIPPANWRRAIGIGPPPASPKRETSRRRSIRKAR